MMRRTLELAARGSGQVSPGPLVGCVIVDDRNEIVGEGYTFTNTLSTPKQLLLNKPVTVRAVRPRMFRLSRTRIRDARRPARML